MRFLHLRMQTAALWRCSAIAARLDLCGGAENSSRTDRVRAFSRPPIPACASQTHHWQGVFSGVLAFHLRKVRSGSILLWNSGLIDGLASFAVRSVSASALAAASEVDETPHLLALTCCSLWMLACQRPVRLKANMDEPAGEEKVVRDAARLPAAWRITLPPPVRMHVRYACTYACTHASTHASTHSRVPLRDAPPPVTAC